jgi:hypothetical protein
MTPVAWAKLLRGDITQTSLMSRKAKVMYLLKTPRFEAVFFSAIMLFACAVHALTPVNDSSALPGIHDFDFEFGQWHVHHRTKLADGKWIEFDGTASARSLTDGSADIEEHAFFKPAGKTYGVGLRAFDRKTGTWAIWWLDSRAPHLPMDPPVIGRFRNGIGTFFSDSVVNGKTVRTRYVWSYITRETARWEQALSTDAGKTWETNWIMEFRRVP